MRIKWSLVAACFVCRRQILNSILNFKEEKEEGVDKIKEHGVNSFLPLWTLPQQRR